MSSASQAKKTKQDFLSLFSSVSPSATLILLTCDHLHTRLRSWFGSQPAPFFTLTQPSLFFLSFPVSPVLSIVRLADSAACHSAFSSAPLRPVMMEGLHRVISAVFHLSAHWQPQQKGKSDGKIFQPLSLSCSNCCLPFSRHIKVCMF